MKFERAFVMLCEGARVRRYAWKHGVQLAVDDSGEIAWRVGDRVVALDLACAGVDIGASCLTSEDYLADDWAVVADESQPT